MTTINPEKLIFLRKQMGLTASALADEAKLGRATVTRIENGNAPKPREHTIKQLAKALRRQPSELATPPEAPAQNDPILGRSRMQLGMSDAAQNALILVARRYGESRESILELAPLLFDLVARESLRERKSRLAELDAHRSAISAMSNKFPHLSGRFTCDWAAKEFDFREERSIERADLRGAHVHADETMDDAFYPNEFDDETSNPFVTHLRSRLLAIAEDGREGATIEAWSRYVGPWYEIGLPEALEIAGDDEVIADALVRGVIRIDAIPTDLLRKDQIDERKKWAHQRLKEHSSRMNEIWGELGIDLSDLREG